MIINHLGLSSGKDSTALLGWAIHESGYPRESIRTTFCDTENEYPEVYRQIENLSEYCVQHGVEPVRTLRNTDSWTWELSQHSLFLRLAILKKAFPAARKRFCTEYLKIIPSIYWLQEQQLQGYEVIMHSGVRGSESQERALMEEWSWRDGHQVRRPMLKWTISDVWESHRKWGLPVNPLYLTGRRRVGCRLCCMSGKQDIRITAKTKPETIDIYREWERIAGSFADGGVSTFMSADKIPKRRHSIRGLTRSKDSRHAKKGETYSTGTIDDVVRWSMTLRGGREEGFAFMYEDDPIFNLDDAHEPCKSGVCE